MGLGFIMIFLLIDFIVYRCYKYIVTIVRTDNCY